MFRRLAEWVRYRQQLSRERSDARTRAYGRRLRDRLTDAEWADYYMEVADRQRLSNVATSATAEAEADSIHSLSRVNGVDEGDLSALLARSLGTLRDQASYSADELAFTSRAFQSLITEDEGDLFGDGEDIMDHADEIHMVDDDRPARYNYTRQPVRGRTYSGNNIEFTINYETSSQELWERVQADNHRRVVHSRPRYYPQQTPRIPVRPGALHAFDPDTEIKVYEQTEDEVAEVATDTRPDRGTHTYDWDTRTYRPRFIANEDIW